MLHSTPLTTLFSSVEYKPASAYLDSPLHGSTPILRSAVNLFILAVPRLQLLCAPRAFRKDLSFVLCFFPYSSHPLHILSVHMASCSSSMLTTLSSVAISKDNYDTPVNKLELCLLNLHIWFCYNGLALNPDKFEAIVFGTTQCSRSLPITSNVNVAGTLVQVFNQDRILGVTLDSRLSFDAYISALSKSGFYHVRALRHIRLNFILDCSKNIACSLIGCRLDYTNLTLVGISVKNIYRLQRLQSTLAHIVTCQRGCISISKTLQEFHWLPIKWRIDYKVATLTYKLLESVNQHT